MAAVWLINPHGINIGAMGRINVARFVASTLQVNDGEFIAGRDIRFVGPSKAAIVNHGTIEAIGGDIYLIANHVDNQGMLKASAGSVNLMAGSDVLLTQDHEIYIRPSGLEADGGTGVANGGVIDAVVARLEADGNMYALAINNSGVVRANGSVTSGGRVFLKGTGGSLVNTGTVSAQTTLADGKTVGGEVQITADNVTIADGARIDASGDVGGGTVLIGGGIEGADASIANATTTTIEAGAVVAADAVESGTGGTVVAYSNDATTVSGALSAKGAGGADGGFVETSGAVVNLDGMDLAIGAGGMWLLDPITDIIDATQAQQIALQLNADSSVLRTATSAILVNADIIASPALATTFLRLKSGGSIALNANIDLGVGSLQLSSQTSTVQVPGTMVAAGSMYLKGMGLFDLTQPGNDIGTLGVVVSGLNASCRSRTSTTSRSAMSARPTAPRSSAASCTSPRRTGTSRPTGCCRTKWPRAITRWATSRSPRRSSATRHTNSGSRTGVPTAERPRRSRLSSVWPRALERPGYRSQRQRFGGDDRFRPPRRRRSGLRLELPHARDVRTVLGKRLQLHDDQPGRRRRRQLLADAETARSSGKQGSGEWSWYTGWDDLVEQLNGVDPYTLGLGCMNVDAVDYLPTGSGYDYIESDQYSRLDIRNIFFESHEFPTPVAPEPIFLRIFDHVEDFPHLRPDERVINVGPELLAPVLNDVSTYFDEASQFTDPRHWYQSVGSIYQVPR